MGNMHFSSERSEDISKVSLNIIDYIKEAISDVSDSVLFDVRLCVEEAVRNAMKHGNKLSPHKDVEVSYEISKEQIVITVKDKGEGFDHKEVPDPTEKEHLYKDHGRGIFIIQKLMDRVTYNNKGNVVEMIKRLT